MLKNLAILSFLFLSSVSWGGYTYEDLKIQDYEEMRKLIDSYIQKTQTIASELVENKEEEAPIDPNEALFELKTAVKILFKRPDTDGLRSSLLPPLETEISTYKPFIDVLAEVVRESLPILKRKKSSVVSQASMLYIIENAMSHAKSLQKPEADAIFSDIKKAKIKLSDKLINHLRLNEGRGQMASPSHIAKKILKQRLKKRAVAKKAKAKIKAKAKAEAEAEAEAKIKAKAEAKKALKETTKKQK